jgi:GNAT superfamily N-acetyltransferase
MAIEIIKLDSSFGIQQLTLFLIQNKEYVLKLKSQGLTPYVNVGADKPEDVEHFVDKYAKLTFNHPLSGSYLIFEDGDYSRAIGWVYLQPELQEGLMEQTIALLPDAHGKGYGQQVLDYIIERVKPYVGQTLPYIKEVEVYLPLNAKIKTKKELREKIIPQQLRGLLSEVDTLNYGSIAIHCKTQMRLIDYHEKFVPHKDLHGHALYFTYPELQMGLTSEAPQFETHVPVKEKLQILNSFDKMRKDICDKHSSKQTFIFWQNKANELRTKAKESPRENLALHESIRHSLEIQKSDSALWSKYKLKIT